MEYDINDFYPGGSEATTLKEVSFNISANLYHPVIDRLKDSIEKKRWFEGIVLGSSFYESLAIEKILCFYDSTGKNIKPDRLRRFSFERLVILLYSLGLISEKDYSQLLKYNKFRNLVVHQLIKIDSTIAEKFINSIIDCWDKLRKTKI